jgi:hypothetical protein
MKKLILVGIALLLLLPNLSPLQAGPDDRILCPPKTGTFTMTAAGLAVSIVTENGQPVTPHTELLANVGKDADAVTGCGLFVFNSHVDKESGRLFIHWETLKPAN